ncbi:hypothetical protein [Streptomyces sp. I6]|uniref:hypothetical protein n=1 Tax=Streptomyces sp. I6 TaxID=2483113 RepID=UPI0011CDCC1B|nr:hypothetical protein [Streptomyces sp. I6]
MVRRGVLADLAWWDHVRPDGLALLVGAVDGEQPEPRDPRRTRPYGGDERADAGRLPRPRQPL